MRKIFVLLLVIGITSCKSTKRATEDKFVLENLSSLNAEEVNRRYADANLREDVGVFEEGTVEMPYTILYPDTPNEIQITWKDNSRSQINDIRFSDSGNWRSNSGIKVGTTYEELNRMNGKDISFYGFGWDYSGAVMWNDGKLEDSNLRVFLAPDGDIENKFYGDHVIEASQEEIREMDLKVQTIIYKS